MVQRERPGTLEDRLFMQELGRQLREERDSLGWTRAELSNKLASNLGDRAILSYEIGSRYMSVARLVELCRAMCVDMPALLARVARTVEAFPAVSLNVDMFTIARRTTRKFQIVHRWAASRVSANPTRRIVCIEPREVATLATVMGCTHETLANYLAGFLSDAIPD